MDFLVPNRLYIHMTLLLLIAGASAASAAEVHLRRKCRVAGALVTLGDVGEVFSQNEAEKSRLSAIELFPTPVGTQSRLVRLRDVQDMLIERGLNLRTVRLAGASTVRVYGDPQQAIRLASSEEPPLLDSLKQQLETLIADYLQEQIDGDVVWRVSVESDRDLLAKLSTRTSELRIQGGKSPYTGHQVFQAHFWADNRPLLVNVDARVSRPAGVVVAASNLKRGDVIHAADLELTYKDHSITTDDVVVEIDHAIGYEVTRPITAGQTIPRSGLQLPQLVRRGDVVTVFSRTRGIQVRTSAKAKEDGSRDALIQLESLLDRDQTFTARVTGRKEVEIFAGAPRVISARSNSPSAFKTPKDMVGPTRTPASVGRPSLFGLRVGTVNEEHKQ